MSKKIYVTVRELRKLYLVKQLPMEEIARRKGCSLGTIYRRLCEAGISRRSHREAIRLARGLQLDDEELAAMYREGLSANKIAHQAGCSVATVLVRLQAGGVARRSSSEAMLLDRGVQISDEQLRELYVKKRLSAGDIAQQVECTSTTIYRHLKRAGIPRRSTSEAQALAWVHGKCTPKLRTIPLTDKQLRAMYIDEQMSISDIARRVGCSLTTISQRLSAAGIPARALNQALRLAVLQGKRRVILVNRDFFKRWSREMAYVLGVIVTDGNLASDKPRVMIAQRERELLDKVSALMDCDGGISWTGNRIYRLSFQTPEVYADLMALGLTPRKSLTIQWPHVPRQYLRDFVRGCWDGDGSVSFQKWRTASASFYSGSLAFMKGMRKALVRLGIPEKIVNIQRLERRNSVYYQIHLNRHRAAPLFEILYANTPETMCLSRKRKIFEMIAEKSTSITTSSAKVDF